jgi:hypothetical protein
VIAFFASRKRLWAVGGLWGGLLLAAFDAYAAIVTYIPQYAVRNDFRLMYGAALLTERHGYSNLYNLPLQQKVVEGLGPGFYYSPFINPPPLVWLVTPFTALPFGAAIIAWTVVIIAAAAIAWWLVAPGDRLTRAAFGAMWLGLFPVAFGIMVGQPVALVGAAVATCWWLSSRDRDWLAGLALSVIVVKPQLALFVPLCVLAAGRGRIFAGWLVPTASMAVVALALLGADGLARYRDALTLASNWQITRSFAVSGVIGTGPQLYVASLIALAAAVTAAWRWRGRGVEVPIAAGIVGSLLFTPYVGFQDFAMLVIAAWLVVRTGPNAWQMGLLVAGYALLEVCLLVQSVPILIAEGLLLASCVYWAPRRAGSDTARLPSAGPLDAAANAALTSEMRN